MLTTLLSWALLPLGIVLGLALARRGQGGSDEQRTTTMQGPLESRSAGTGDSETIELQLTLGSLFRKRGELDRAIQLHEAVLARPALSTADSASARLELAQDFLRGGVMDRAESLLQTLVSHGEHMEAALELLLDLHEQGRDWRAAIDTATRLQAVRGRSQAARIAHHHCELAENARHDGDLDKARHQALKALDIDHGCARASLLLASLAEAERDWRTAAKAYVRAIEQDRRYLAEVLAPLKRCHAEAGDQAGYLEFLDDAVADHPDSTAVALARADVMSEQGGDVAGFLATRLASIPNWRALLRWIEVDSAGSTAAQPILAAFRQKLQQQPRYACSSCGLKPSVLFWQCPSCKQWATIAPAREDL